METLKLVRLFADCMEKYRTAFEAHYLVIKYDYGHNNGLDPRTRDQKAREFREAKAHLIELLTTINLAIYEMPNFFKSEELLLRDRLPKVETLLNEILLRERLFERDKDGNF